MCIRDRDMLTLSATPIPRTLNMALSGIRDMSTICLLYTSLLASLLFQDSHVLEDVSLDLIVDLTVVSIVLGLSLIHI